MEFDFTNGQDGPNFGYWSQQSWTINNSTNGIELESGCKAYPYDISPPDTTFKVGRTFNLLALILGASFLFLDILTGCASANHKRSVRQAGGVGYLVVSFCSGMSLLILQVFYIFLCAFALKKKYFTNFIMFSDLKSDVCTDNDINGQLQGLQGTCKLSKGGKSVIVATALWFIAAWGIIAMHPWNSNKKGSVHDDRGLDEPLVDQL